ncbi:MAG: hypothetical protein MK207_04960 [Saprospiraceae bacterium]|nr:hypothetical protein [Saprospiraceae bacterium]
MRSINFLLVSAALLLVASCSKQTVETETKRWELAKTNIDRLNAKYPGFSLALEQISLDANAQWESALEMGEEDKKIEAMRATVLMVSRSFVRPLSSISRKIQELKDLPVEVLETGTIENEDKEALFIAQSEANITIKKIEEMLNSVQIASVQEATTLLEGAVNKLKTASDNIEEIMKSIKEKEKNE